jgi:hypothetical protein
MRRETDGIGLHRFKPAADGGCGGNAAGFHADKIGN